MSNIFTSIAVSLDGYIASTSGDLSWLNESMAQGEDYGFDATMKRTGIFIMGANTYREMMKSGMAGGYSHTSRPARGRGATFWKDGQGEKTETRRVHKI